MLAGIPPTARKHRVAPAPFPEQDRAGSVAWFLHFLLCDAGPGSDLTSLSLSLATGKVKRISRQSLRVAVRGTEGAFSDPEPILRGQAPPGPAWASGPHSGSCGLASLLPATASGLRFLGPSGGFPAFLEAGQDQPFQGCEPRCSHVSQASGPCTGPLRGVQRAVGGLGSPKDGLFWAVSCQGDAEVPPGPGELQLGTPVLEPFGPGTPA